jgi:hypothetical protein
VFGPKMIRKNGAEVFWQQAPKIIDLKKITKEHYYTTNKIGT